MAEGKCEGLTRVGKGVGVIGMVEWWSRGKVSLVVLEDKTEKAPFETKGEVLLGGIMVKFSTAEVSPE